MKKILSLLILVFSGLLAFSQPEDPNAMHETAKTFMRTGDFENAIVVLTREIQNNKDIELEKDPTLSYYMKRDYTKALEYMNKALPLAPNDQNKQAVQAMIDKLKAGKDVN